MGFHRHAKLSTDANRLGGWMVQNILGVGYLLGPVSFTIPGGPRRGRCVRLKLTNMPATLGPSWIRRLGMNTG